jgi:hypothetical protein
MRGARKRNCHCDEHRQLTTGVTRRWRPHQRFAWQQAEIERQRRRIADLEAQLDAVRHEQCEEERELAADYEALLASIADAMPRASIALQLKIEALVEWLGCDPPPRQRGGRNDALDPRRRSDGRCRIGAARPQVSRRGGTHWNRLIRH